MSKILIVEDDNTNRAGLVQFLRQAGYEAIGAATFEQGRQLMAAEKPDLLVTDLRLEGFNGLQLIITRLNPIPAIVITGFADHTLEAEAKQLGAAYLVKPFAPAALLSLVEEKLRTPVDHASFDVERRWARKRLPKALSAQAASARARVVEVSYGGLRLELDANLPSTLPASFDVTLTEKNVAVHVDLVWQTRTRGGGWLCGASLAPENPAAENAWHGFVDHLT